MPNKQQIIQSLQNNLPFEPTSDQSILLGKIADFLTDPSPNCAFVLKGYAGTGKTSIVSSLVKTLPLFNIGFVLLAPTGRAAKVMSSYSGKAAYTIHKHIYRFKESISLGLHLQLSENNMANALFIVDEASMIAYSEPFGDEMPSQGRNLLDDLVEFVSLGHNCRLMFIGDSAQLPPVKLSESPALDISFLKASYHFDIYTMELTEVMRQAEGSGILANATKIRKLITSQTPKIPHFKTKGFKDIVRLQGNEMGDALQSVYSSDGIEQSIIICRSNKRANLFNQQIRNRILFQESEIAPGDILMVVKNNYFWLPNDSKAGFIANGDLIKILRARKLYELYGFRFMDICFQMLDYPDEPEVDARIILDTIHSESPSLTREQSQKLYEEILNDYMDIPSKAQRLKKIKTDPFYNALQVKFAYAVTCHKAQGGQWEHVFLEQGIGPDLSTINTEYLRWLYTAFTRATKNLFLINFADDFFK